MKTTYMKQTTYIKHIAITLLAFIMNGTVHAAIITWGNNAAAYAIVNQNDVSTNGILVQALNGGASDIGSIQVGNVTFQNEMFLPQGITGFFNRDTGDNNYNVLLDSVTHDGDTASSPFNLSIGGGQLITDYTYELQVWFADTRNAFRSVIYEDGSGGATVNIGANGGYAIGTFVADGASQNLTMYSPPGSDYNANINAFQIRQIAVPEPETYALIFGALSLAYVMLRRRF